MNSKNCEHCKTAFKTKSALNNHKNKARYCLIIQGKIEDDNEEYKCSICEKILLTKAAFEVHKKNAKEEMSLNVIIVIIFYLQNKVY